MSTVRSISAGEPRPALYYHYGIPKCPLPEKMFGVFAHTVDYKRSILFRGFDDTFMVPHSRHTTVDRADVERIPSLRVLASSRRPVSMPFPPARAAASLSWAIPSTIPGR